MFAGVKAEAAFKKDGTVPDPDSTDNPEFHIVLKIIKRTLNEDPQKWTKMANKIVGVSEETTTGVKRLYEMQVRPAHLSRFQMLLVVPCWHTWAARALLLMLSALLSLRGCRRNAMRLSACLVRRCAV